MGLFGGSSKSRTTTTNQAFDNRSFVDNRSVDNSDRSTTLFNQIDQDIDNSVSLSGQSVMAGGNVTINSLADDVVRDVIDAQEHAFNQHISLVDGIANRSTELSADALDKALAFSQNAQTGSFELVKDVAERAQKTTSDALAKAFSQTVAGLSSDQQEIIKTFGMAALIMAGGFIIAGRVFK